jgi:hypothetical protein
MGSTFRKVDGFLARLGRTHNAHLISENRRVLTAHLTDLTWPPGGSEASLTKYRVKPGANTYLSSESLFNVGPFSFRLVQVLRR